MYLMYLSLRNPSWGTLREDGTRVTPPVITAGVKVCSCSAMATQLITDVAERDDGTTIGSITLRDAREAVGLDPSSDYYGYLDLLYDVLVVVRKLPDQLGFLNKRSYYTFYNTEDDPAVDAYQVYLGWQLWRQWSQQPAMVDDDLLAACRDASRPQKLINVLRFLWLRAQHTEAAYYDSALDVVRTMTASPLKYGKSIIDPNTNHYAARRCSVFVPGTPRGKVKRAAQETVARYIRATGWEYTTATDEVLAAAAKLLPKEIKQEVW